MTKLNAFRFLVGIGFISVGHASLAAQETSNPIPPQPVTITSEVSRMNFDEIEGEIDQFRRNGSRTFDSKYKLATAEKKALLRLTDEIDAKRPSDLAGALAEADRSAVSPDARFILGVLQLRLAGKTNDHAMQMKATKMIIDSGSAPAGALVSLNRNLASLALQANNLEVAEGAYEKVVALRPEDADSAVTLAQIKIDRGEHKDALDLLDRAIELKVSAGQEVPALWRRVAEATKRRVVPAN